MKLTFSINLKCSVTQFLVIGLLFLFTNVQAQLDNPDWGDNTTSCVTDALLYPGVAVVTCGVVEEVPVAGRYVVAYLAMNNAIPTAAPFRDNITDPDSALHSSDWLVSNIGNVFGTAINQQTAEVFVTASSNYGAGFGFLNNSPSVLNYGVVGSPANATEAAGTVYRIDPVTGAVTVFVRLPQQSTTLQHWDCEDDAIEITRTNTGVGLGNIAYDELNDQFFVTNAEDGRIYRISNAGVILDSYDPKSYDTGVVGIDSLQEVPYGIAVEPGSNRLFFGFVDDPGPGPAGAQALPGAPKIFSIDLNSSGGFVGTVDNTIMPSGATYDNYVGTDQEHGSIPTSIPGGGFSFTAHTTYFISDLAFAPDGTLLVGVRVGCYGSWHSSYNHWAETDVISLNVSNNLYDTTPIEYDISVDGDAADEDGYGGVATYELNDGSCDVHYLASFGDVLTEDGPHGITIWDSGTTSAPVSPIGVFEYGVLPNEDPKGIGGDVEVYNGCSAACNITGTTTACEGDNIELTYTPACSGSIFTWQITSGNATIVGVNDSTVVAITAGDNNFTASVILTGVPEPCTYDVTVSPLQNPSITAAGPFCLDDSAVNLSASPSGGTFSGTGITNGSLGTFNPATAGVGTHTITYTLPGICMESATIDIVVNGLPVVSVSGGPFCVDAAASNLTGSPAGGTFSGTGITDGSAGTFDPATAGVGTHTITYLYTDGNGCSNSATTDVVVNALPVVSVSGGPFCVDAAASNLTGSPAGGTFSGTGITDGSAGTFDPATAGVGTHTITYLYTDGNGCSNSATTDVVVNGLPVVSVSGGPFCVDAAASNLTGSPAGGTFSGTGITDGSAGTFDPATAGVGTHTITYLYTDGNGCSNSATTDVVVNALPVVSVSGGPFCVDAAASNLTGSPAGGTFSGTGITDGSAGTFDPATAGVGTHTITYLYTDGNGCSNSATTDVVVNALPVVSVSGGPFCVDAAASNLTGSPAGGTFSGTGITDGSAGTFDPATAGVGTHTITYLYTDGNGCSNSATTDVVVNALPVVSVSGGPFCVDAAASNLTGSPAGGTFSGTGITDGSAGTFDPATAGVGTHTITYAYTDGNGCSNSATTDVVVNALPVVSVSGGPFCVDAAASNLTGSPAGGTFSGTGITDGSAGTFDPATAGVGTHTITYAYTDGNGCSNSATTDVVVNALPVVSVSGGPFCVDAAASNLTGSPAGGTFSGTGITDGSAGTFDPATAGVGTHTITYLYTDGNGCSNSATTDVVVNALPVVSVSGGPFCVDAAASNLTGSPAGGTFSGTGITDGSAGTFDPATAGVGTHTITYLYTDGNGCSNSATTDVVVNALPVVSVSGGPFCVDAAASNLTGSPAGGTFSGTGITDGSAGTFDPATAGVGTHTITYLYTDGNGCSNSATTDVVVNALPVVSVSGGPFCVDAAASNLTGSPAGGTFSGTGITDGSAGTFDPATAGVGVHTITYTYTDSNGCTNSASDDIEVFALPVVTFTALPDLCIDAGVQAGLGGGSPTGGVYSGTGVTDNGNGLDYDFDPAAAGVGVHTITYTYTDGNGCTNSASDDVEVFALPVVTFTALADLCIDAGVQAAQTGASPIGGVYSGIGVTDNGNGTDYDFDPAIAGVGVHTITYTYTDGNGCVNSASDDVEVFALPVVTFIALADLCIDAGVQAAQTGGSPTGGVYSGTGVTDNGNGIDYDFDPAVAGVGVHTITFTYTDGNGCINSASDDVVVNALPVVSVSGGPFCVDAAASNLTASPTGGTFSGSGITDGSAGTFDPATAGVGTHTITYDYTDGNGCSNSATTDVVVNALPVVSVSGGPFCINNLPEDLIGSPAGGTFSGSGIIDGSAGTFDPATAGVGTHTITYDYTDGNGCSNSATTDVVVNDLPTLNLSGGPFCVDDAPSNLTASPIGGTFSGTGITDGSAGTFDPAIAGVGVHTIYYDFADVNGCRNSTFIDVEVFALPVVSVSGGPFCVDAAASNLTGSPAGGTFSGTGITDGSAGTFDPATAGVGTHTITYAYTDGNGCSNSATTDVIVNALPVVSVSGGPFCVDAAASNLTASPIGGTFSGTGITDAVAGTFDPAIAGVGTHTISYYFRDINGCSNTATTDIVVFDIPIVTVSGGPFCFNDTPSNLTASPIGGTFSGIGITDGSAGTFDPATAGVGTHTVTYTYTDGNGCSNSAMTDILVNDIPPVIILGQSFCIDDAPDNLFGSPAGGIFSGIGITDASAGTFNPAISGVGVFNITYEFTDGNGCTAISNADVIVNALPIVNVSGGPFCINDMPSNLTGSPVGGTFTGSGITDGSAGTFDPAIAGIGTHTIVYDFTDVNGCSNTSSVDIIVNDLPDVEITGGPFCLNDIPSDLMASPLGGTFSGTGITDGSAGTFDPSIAGVGTHTITYDYTDVNGCSNSATVDVIVNALPIVSVSGGPFCIDDLAIDLTASPLGGMFSGTGIIDGLFGTFDPLTAGVGIHTITYDYTDSNGCSNSATVDITVNALPVVSVSGSSFCIDDLASNLTASPAGGTFSGTGITNGSAGTFDPATAGVGLHTITYTYTDGNGCVNSASDDVEVFALPVVTFTALADLCIDAGVQAAQTGGSPTGGVYSGLGVTDNGNGLDYDFDPMVAGVGLHTIRYTYTDGNGCVNSASDDVEVFALPVVTFTALADLCIDAGVQAAQTGGSPIGGVYSGAGVTDNGNGLDYDFDPMAAGVGVHSITYTYTDGNGCINTASDDVEVFDLPVVTFTALADLCIDAGVQAAQTGGSPTGGVYSGTGVTDNGNGTDYDFDPMAAGVGVHTITYTYTDGNGCVNSASDDVEVFDLPVVTFTALADLCIDASVQASQGGGSPAGGIYSGPGVTDNGNGTDYDFDPMAAGVGVHTITYTYTDGNGCVNSASDDVEVFDLPVVTFTALADLCIDAGVQAAQGGGSPAGGIYSGAGVTDNGNGTDYDFDPMAAGVGVHTITYTYTDGNGCVNSASDDVEVFDLPVVTFTAPADLCIDTGLQAAQTGGSPAGGVYSGIGVTDNGNGTDYDFDPAIAGVGVHTITYTYTDGNGCTNSASDDVEVFDLPVVTFTAPADLCIDSGLQAAQTGGSPAGGVYSGTGVTDNGNGTDYDFDPAIAGVGVHTITYTYTDGNGCVNSASDDIEVFDLPVVTFTAPADLCIDAGLQASQTGGSPTGGVYSGTGVIDNGNGTDYNFDPAAAGVGVHTITYTYTDGNGCVNSASDDVEVFALPVVTFTAPADLCIDAGVQAAQTGGNPAGGVYSGIGVTDNGNGLDYDFDPATAGVGVHTITYTYTDGNGCTNSASDDVEVFDLPVVTFTAPADLCIDAGVQTAQTGGSPIGGIYSGAGVTDNGNGTDYDFDPTTAGVGVHTITYTYTDGNGCVNSASDDIEVFDLPVVDFSISGNLCIDAGVQVGLGSGTPSGGVYSGAGVTDDGNGMTYSFDPSIAGVGVHTITYTFNDSNGCIDSASDNVEVFALPVVTFIALTDLCVDAGVQAGLSGGSPTGGIYSGTGVTDDGNGMTYSFDPAIAGVGIHTITYDYADGNGCSNSASDDVEVFALPVVTFTALVDLCIDAGVQASQTGGSPIGGVYSGPGVTDNGNGLDYDFDPATAGVGVHTITYTYTDSNGCTNSASDDVEVFDLPVVTFTALADLCIDAGVQAAQVGGSPIGGIYSGAGVTDNGNGTDYDFDPAAAGIGVHTITYTYTDGNGCTNSASDDVEVFDLPVVTFTAIPDLCIDAGVQAAQTGGSPIGGIYSGTGVTDNGNGTDYDFDPATAGVGVHTITYTYMDGNGCVDSASDDVEVFALPVVTFVALADVCIDAGVQAGLGGGSPTGGVYSGAGVTDNGNGTDYDFDPATAGVGVHTITYTYTDGNGCVNSASDDVEVFDLPVVTFTALPDLCIDSGVQAAQGGGNPTGGIYSGTGVTDNGNGLDYDFDPAIAGVGVHTITYIYTDGNGCVNNASDDVEVFALPMVTFSALADLCIDAGVQAAITGGGPTGGVYSGTGVTDNGNGIDYDFDPAIAGVGVHTITYTYTDGNGCVNSASDDVEVFALPVVDFTTPDDLCIDVGIQAGLSGGTPAGGIYSGVGVSDDANGVTYSFDPAIAGSGTHTITYTFTDGNGCTDSASDDIEVFDLPVVDFSTSDNLCIDSGVQVGLGNGIPSGGVYSGLGVTDDGNGLTYSFDPAIAGVGVHTITYTFTDSNGCIDSASDIIEVFALPVVDFTALASLCIDAGVQAGLTGGTPTGGIYSGSGVTDDGNGMTYSFDPAIAGVGVHTITYTFTDINGCTDSASDNVEVFGLPIVEITPPGDLCIDAGVQSGLSGGTPTGGVYSGTGVTDDGNGMTYSFDPAGAGVGTHTITYDYTDSNGCSNSASVDITVNPLPVPTIDPINPLNEVCIGNGLITLIGNPTGGIFSGIGIIDGVAGIFDPKVAGEGIHTITYEYTDINGCVASTTIDISVINCFDLALTKLIDPMGPQGPFVIGDQITFVVTVYNQGQTDAYNVEVEDYLPSNMSFTSSADFALNGASYIANIPFIEAGLSQELSITLELTSYDNVDVINNAEIISADDDTNDANTPPEDEDSDLDSVIGSSDDNSELDTDNDIDDEDPGTPGSIDNPLDQDDYDPSLLPILDLANTKTVNAASIAAAGGTFEPNEIITFEVNVFNQGNVTADNIVVTDTIPCGLLYNEVLNSAEGWTLSGTGGSANYTVASLAPGMDTTILISFSIKPSAQVVADCEISQAVVPGKPFTNYSFIKSADVDGTVQTEDVDSEFDSFTIEEANTNPNENGDDDTDSTGNDQEGSQDDNDPALVEIFDLALSKIVSPWELPYQVGETVTFEICVSSQGNVPSDSINIVDYIPAGLEYNTLSDGLGWTGTPGNSTATFAFDDTTIPGGQLEFGDQVCTDIILTILANETDFVNRSEITSATSIVNDGMGGSLTSLVTNDNDSQFDAIPFDEAGGAVETESDALTSSTMDPAVLGDGTGTSGSTLASTDDDSSDPAFVPIVDFALRKKVADGNANPFVVGDTVRFLIEVLNQGNVSGSNISVNDYIPNNLAFVDNMTNDDWTGASFGQSNVTALSTLTGPLAPGEIDSLYIDLEIIAGGSGIEDYTNSAEIFTVFASPGAPTGIADGSDISAFDVDSTPDGDKENDNGADASSPDSPNNPNPADDYVDGNGLDPAGMPDDGVQATDEDDADPALVAFHDVALTKTKPVDQEPVNIGEVVTFTITVFNQGNSPLDSVRIIDYVPAGFAFTPNNNWVADGLNATLTATVANGLITGGGIPVGGSQEFPIELTVAPTATLTNLVNVAEITGSKDENDLTQDDDGDSTADEILGNDPGGADDTDSDDEVNGDGTGIPGDGVADTDEDDSDPEGVQLALYSIGNQVWIDDNYDGQINGDEVGIDGVAVELYDTSGNLIDMTVTSGGGFYLFDSLLMGDFIVVIPASELAANGSLQDYQSSTGTFNMGGPYENPGVDANTNIDNDDNGTFNTNTDYPGAVVSTVVTLGGDDEPLNENPDNDAITEDKNENLTIDFGFIEKVYDIALIKETDMETGNSFGDDILFTITVTNQGNTPLTNIEVIDYIAPGFETVPGLNSAITDAGGSGWIDNGTTSSTYVIGDTLLPNESREIGIYLTLVSSLLPDAYVNFAEVSEFQDTIGNSTDGTGPYPEGIEDEDSTPDTMNDNDPGGQPESDSDDSVDGDGTGTVGDDNPLTDEDDHDPSMIQVVDIALAKTTVTSAPYVYGQEVEFNIEVINQGNVDLENILISDYFPCGYTFGPSNVGWTEGTGTATYTIPSLDAGESTDISIFFTVIPVSGSCDHVDAYTNFAEVSQMFADYDKDGNFDDDVSLEDADSDADSDDTNDAGGQPQSDADDFVEGDGTGPINDGTDVTDEDDHDPAFITIFDLAQIKFIDNEGPYAIGETATFEFEITNQGNVDAYNIEITDYLSNGFTFSSVGNPGWSVDGDYLVNTIAGPLAPGATVGLTLNLTVALPGAASAASWYNESEISEADDDTIPGNDPPTDADSTPDQNPDNDNDLVDGNDDDPIFDPDDDNDNVIDENPNDPFGLGDDDEDDNDAAGVLVVGGLGDTVWKDLDGDGIQDAGEPGVEGVEVTLTDCNGNILETQTTDSDGFYFFNNLLPGDYQVQFDISGLPAGCIFTQQDQGGDDALDSDVDENGFAPCTTIQGGEYDSTFDAGLAILVNIGDFVWHDTDGDGVQDIGEPGIPDVMVLLYNEDNELIQVTMTDQDGMYLFTNVLPDTYYIVFVDPDGFVSTFPNTTDDENDSDITNFVFTDEGSTTDLFTIVYGQEDDLSFDAGFYRCIPIGERVWYDVDEDDMFDATENGINGLEVNLYRLDGGSYSLYDTQLTGLKPGTPSDDGYYKFCAPPGTYYVEVVMPPIGLVLAKANAFNNLPLTHPNESTEDSDMTNNFGQSTTASFKVESGEMLCNIGTGFYPMAEVGNRVWMDSNENGTQDSGEGNVSNVLVEAFEVETGEKVAESVTNDLGIYNIDYLQKKEYYLKFTPPNGLSFTDPNTGDEDTDSDVDHTFGFRTTSAFSLNPGDAIINVDAGLRFGALPVVWLSVDAEHFGEYNLVTWKTASEVNTESFIVERSVNSIDKFEAIGEVDAAGESTSIQAYAFEDEDVRPGTYYYRIKQLDKDGKFDYSDIVLLKVASEKNEITLAPNPARGKSILTIDLESGQETSVRVIGSDGRLIRTMTIEAVTGQGISTTLDIDELPTGVYSIYINQGTFTEIKKLIIIE